MSVQSKPPPSSQDGDALGAPGEELGFDLPAPAVVSKTRLVAFGLVGAAVLGAAFVVGYLPKRAERAALEEAAKTADPGVLRVEVVAPKETSSDRAIQLPGSVQPLEETTLYARANGFVRKWLVDIGDKVKAGEALVEIDTPELDQELDQARAQLAQAHAALAQAQASQGLSKTNLDRYKALSPSGVVSQAELDQRSAQAQVDVANVNVAQANVAAQEANIRRLVQLKSFSRVTAPFAGTVTQRWVEVGALVTAGNATPLYKVASLDPARVFIQVPQDVAPKVAAGMPANVTIREYAGRAFDGKVARASGELDPGSRTMTTEVRVPNPKGELLPGMYAQVALTLPTPHRVLELPPTALVSDAKGVRVAILDEADDVRFVPVVVERDTGATIEIASGLRGDERVVRVPPPQLTEGVHVEVAKATPAGGPASASSANK
jgi:RND family efflux transporter MFP subunit